jgi:hypothetical protein
MKTNLSIVSIGIMKTLINESKNLSLMSVKVKEECDLRNEVVKFDANYNEIFQDSEEVQSEMSLHESTKDPGLQSTVESKIDPLVNVSLVKKDNNVVDSFSFSFLYSILFLSFLIVSGIWIEFATMNIDVWEMEGMINLIKNAISIFIFFLMNKMIII